MLYLIKRQSQDKVTILDSVDNIQEEISYTLYEQLSKLIKIADISEEQIILSRLLGIETLILEKGDNIYSLRVKLMKIPYKFTVKVYNLSSLEDMQCAFEGVSLSNLDLSDFDTSKVTNMHGMFAKCNISHLDLSNFDTSKVLDMSYMFSKCSAFSIDLSSFDTSNVVTMESMFNSCTVTELDVSNFNTSNVTIMYEMFCNCTLRELDLSNFDTSKVYDMNRMFAGVRTFKLDISSFDTSNVNNMFEMFMYFECKSDIDLSHFNTSKVKHIGSMFKAFVGNKLDLRNFDMSNISDTTSMFERCKINCLDITGWNTSNVGYMPFMFVFSEISSLLGLDTLDTSAVKVMDKMFMQSKISNIDVSKFQTKGVSTMVSMFKDCETDKLEANFDISEHTAITSMFNDCKANILDLRNFKVSKIYKLGLSQIFLNCSSKIILGKSNAKYIGDNLKSIHINYTVE